MNFYNSKLVYKQAYPKNVLQSKNKTYKHIKKKHSRTPRKRAPKMQRLSGRLRKVVVYKNRTTGVLFREEVQVQLLYGR